jgi:predicted NAD/FAD-binding protein
MAKIAIVGTGISGMGAAYLLNPHHEITVYEKADRIGGHSRTVDIDYDGVPIPVDTGFIVFNKRNYPNLSGLFRHLDVPVHKSDMTFGATIGNGWLEWGARDLNAIFAQRRNLLRPNYYRLLHDVYRFNSRALETAIALPHISLGELIERLGMSDWFRRYYLLPMAGAIWSCPPSQMLDFPALSFVRFFENHGLLSVSGQPQWYTVTGGSKEYVKRLTRDFQSQIRLNCGAAEVTRFRDGVEIRDAKGGVERFDHAVFASHADETLASLKDADSAERTLLGSFRYQRNHAVLHKDVSVMPKRKACWASWVYHAGVETDEPGISVSYWMNNLQGIDRRYPLFVTLNSRRAFAREDVFDEHVFYHPVFDADAVLAQQRMSMLQGHRNIWYCGAYLRNGFHEDGISSAVDIARRFGAEIPWDAEPAPVPLRVNAQHDFAPARALAS